jgi:hypothetical protein
VIGDRRGRIRPLAVGALCIALSGCAGSQAHLLIAQGDNTLRVEPSATVPGEYVVTVKNMIDFAYDYDDLASRTTVAKQVLASQCPNGTNVLGETVINHGTNALGRTLRTYSIRVRCGVAPTAQPGPQRKGSPPPVASQAPVIMEAEPVMSERDRDLMSLQR